jgi:hypothetical protein
LTRALPLHENKHTIVQVGLVGYGQYETTDRTGPNADLRLGANPYRVNALGAGANVILPARKVAVGIRYFKEFSNASTVEGHSLQISATVNLLVELPSIGS